jgi:hypothetical protein
VDFLVQLADQNRDQRQLAADGVPAVVCYIYLVRGPIRGGIVVHRWDDPLSRVGGGSSVCERLQHLH